MGIISTTLRVIQGQLCSAASGWVPLHCVSQIVFRGLTRSLTLEQIWPRRRPPSESPQMDPTLRSCVIVVFGCSNSLLASQVRSNPPHVFPGSAFRTLVLSLERCRSWAGSLCGLPQIENVPMSFTSSALMAQLASPVARPLVGAKGYFQELGFSMPPNENPADWMMDVMSGQIDCENAKISREDRRPCR